MITEFTKLRKKILFEYLEKFKETPTRTLARIVLRECPEFFKDYEEARSIIRTYRGTNGKYLRQTVKSNQYFKNVQST